MTHGVPICFYSHLKLKRDGMKLNLHLKTEKKHKQKNNKQKDN